MQNAQRLNCIIESVLHIACYTYTRDSRVYLCVRLELNPPCVTSGENSCSLRPQSSWVLSRGLLLLWCSHLAPGSPDQHRRLALAAKHKHPLQDLRRSLYYEACIIKPQEGSSTAD